MMAGPALLLLLLASPARALWLGSESASRRLEKPVTIDGRADDWPGPEPDDAQGISFSFADDGKDLYVMISPHTQSTRAQMAGAYKQDLALWLDAKGGKARRVGLLLRAPAHPEGPRELEVVGDTGTAKRPAEALVGPIEDRGALEARIPLDWLGTPAPRRFSVEILAYPPAKAPGPVETRYEQYKREHERLSELPGEADGTEISIRRARGGRRDRRPPEAHESEEFSAIDLWVRVQLSGSKP